MRHKLTLMLLAGCAVVSAASVPQSGEELQYSINWPSGLSLGEGKIKAAEAGGKWNFELHVDAAVPGFGVNDKYFSKTDGETCSISFDKDLMHGRRRSQERISFDSANHTATRQTVGGGKSTLEIPACARDALAFVFHLRKELSNGRIPKPQQVFYGAPYQVSIQYGGQQKIRIGDVAEDADRVLATVRGPTSQYTLELFIGRDARRTPLSVKVPSAMGTFALELVR